MKMTIINVLQAIVSNVAASAHVYRQILATFASSLLTLGAGITVGFTAVLLPQLEKDFSFPYDKSFDSWIASICVLAMMMGSLFSGSLSDCIGRRMSLLILIVPFIFGWIIIGVAPNNTVILIGRFITGASAGALRTNNMVYVGELSDPMYRATALFFQSVAYHSGILISHLVGTYCNWKTSCFIFTFPTIVSFVILILLKESPLWLLSKGNIVEGIESYRQFRGNGESANKELSTVLEKTKERAKENSSFKDILSIIFSKPFMKSLAILFILFLAVQWSGINILPFYAQEIFEKTFSGDADAFMLMLVTDCIRILISVFICFFAKIMPLKIVSVVCSFTISIVLIGLVIYLYLSLVGLVWVAITCMVFYICMASVFTSMAWLYITELFPSKVRGLGSGWSAAINFMLLFISVKITPEIMTRFGEKVMYSGFAGITLFSGFLLSFILPETNGRSLQDIEDSMYKMKADVKKDIDGPELKASV